MGAARRAEVVGRLGAGISHDLNNLLTVISGYSGLVLSQVGDGDPRLRADVEAIAAAADQAVTLTRSLFAGNHPDGEALAAESGNAEHAGGTERILLVEDDPQVRELVLTILREQGYEVHEADSPETALAMLGEERAYDLLLTDVVMPKMNGTELADRVSDLHPGIRVLYISAYTGSALVETASLAPGRAFVQKPFNARALSDKIRELLDADPAPAAA